MTFVAAENRYSEMTYRRTGRSGLKLPALSLGLWHNFGHERSIDTQRAILRRAFDLGVTHFDLANNYGPPPGSAETNFGRIFAEDFRAYRDEMIISSKAGYDMWPGPYGDFGSRKYLLSSLDASLGRLGLDYVDIFYSHRPDPETPIEETMGALASAVQQGKALYVGISSYTPEQTRAAAAALAEHNVPLLIHQPRYSMFDRHIEDGLFPVLDELGVGSICFSPLAQGLLTDRYLSGSVPADSRVATSRFLSEDVLTDSYLDRVRGLNAIAVERGQTLAQLAVTWILRQQSVTSVLVGASSVGQLEQTVAALDAPALTDEEIAAIEPFAVHGTGLS
ncbi:L-glyceraldehyde 3-phosphate reductase [Cryobacterium sp. PH31-AA6]|uniref:L-glyceraldehyde 3-phosphate reductase n=1 Tax=Cryobacterium sp. PH31-AA6 TaxID=3046205 RepID=UPI0024B97426|nr:L-glyceraldehyde 3-phosphate reductase [Cryobacterium sp. PH31-AA6]MDJ0324500.1 L-glyceraldehyde 3-phosphate reductase [Cryobacterium sp. PH31-AA6]